MPWGDLDYDWPVLGLKCRNSWANGSNERSRDPDDKWREGFGRGVLVFTSARQRHAQAVWQCARSIPTTLVDVLPGQASPQLAFGAGLPR